MLQGLSIIYNFITNLSNNQSKRGRKDREIIYFFTLSNRDFSFLVKKKQRIVTENTRTSLYNHSSIRIRMINLMEVK